MRLATRICETGRAEVFETGDVAPQQNKDLPMVKTPPIEARPSKFTFHTAAV
jgi:hypothetical protein